MVELQQQRAEEAGPVELVVRDLGQMPYDEAYIYQKDRQREVIDARRSSGGEGRPLMYLLLLEHVPPVITLTRRPGSARNLIATPEQLENAGVQVAETDRGGDITYHGPGQLVVYPILDLNVLGLRLHGYMRFLEQLVIDLLTAYGITAHRDEQATGVWVKAKSGSHDAKICAMGVRVSRWVSMHGLALNVTTNLSHFDLIVPCGLANRNVTSMKNELGEQYPSMDDVKRSLIERFEAAITTAVNEAPETKMDMAEGEGAAG